MSGISSFLVTNARFPEKIETLTPVMLHGLFLGHTYTLVMLRGSSLLTLLILQTLLMAGDAAVRVRGRGNREGYEGTTSCLLPLVSCLVCISLASPCPACRHLRSITAPR
jgi:hypothetical protein